MMHRPRTARRALWLVLGSLLLSLLGSASAVAQTAGGGQPTAEPKLTKPPALLQFVEAEYPEAEKASGRSAAVVLQLTISATGAVDEAAVAESAGAAFDAAAVAAAKRFVFSPAEIDGKPAPIRILYRYEFVLRVEAPTTAIFAGTVRNRDTNTGLPGVTVALDSGQSAVTDAAGKYQILDVAPGKHAVSLSGPQLTALRTEETFEAGQQLDATYDVQLEQAVAEGEASEDLEIVVTAPPLRRQVVSTQVSAEQARKVPGTQGDVLRVVESLPGVARSAVGSGALVVWGAAPEDTRVYVDGVRVPRLYHDGGLRSVVHSDFVDSVELVPGGYGSPYGRGLGGLVTVTTRSIAADGVHGSVGADLLDISGSVRAPLADKLHVAIAARRSHLDELLSGVIDDDVEDFFPIPHYYDLQSRVRYEPSERSSLELTVLASGDHISRTRTYADPARTTREARKLAFQRVYVGYRNELADGTVLALTPFIGFDQAELENRVGSVPTELSNDSVLGGMRSSFRKQAEDWLTLEVGLDAELDRASLTRSGSIGAPAREGDVRVFGQPPPDQINADRWKTTAIGVAPYVDADIALFAERLHLFPGLRLDPNATTVNRRQPPSATQPQLGSAQADLALEPRISARYAISDRIAVKAAFGVYHQSPQPEDLSATFGNPSLTTSRAEHWVLGASWAINDTLALEATGFYARSHDLTVRSPFEAPLSARALVQDGDGRALGAQVLLRQELSEHFFGWLSYSFVRSERRANDGAEWRPFDFDQTHVLTALFSYDLGKGWEVGSRFRYATGYPRSEVLDAYYDARRDLFQPIFGSHNALRLPSFWQLDLRASKRFLIGATQLNAYLELQNVSNRENAEEIVYDADYSQKQYITGLPLLPVAGVSWEF